MTFVHGQIIQPFLLKYLDEIRTELRNFNSKLPGSVFNGNKDNVSPIIREVKSVSLFIFGIKILVFILGFIIIVLWFAMSFLLAYGYEDIVIENFGIILIITLDILFMFGITSGVLIYVVKKKFSYIQELTENPYSQQTPVVSPDDIIIEQTENK